LQNAQAFYRHFVELLACLRGTPGFRWISFKRHWFKPSVSRNRLRIVGRCFLVQVLYSENTNVCGFHGKLFENIGCRPTIGNVGLIVLCVFICHQKKRLSIRVHRTLVTPILKNLLYVLLVQTMVYLRIEEHWITFLPYNEASSRNTPEAGRSVLFRNVGICFRNYTAFHPQRQIFTVCTAFRFIFAISIMNWESYGRCKTVLDSLFHCNASF